MDQLVVLILGDGSAFGQELAQALGSLIGGHNIVATDLDPIAEKHFGFCRFEPLNIYATEHLERIIRDNKVNHIYLLTSIPFKETESNPLWISKNNLEALLSVLEVARKYCVKRVFWPSSISVFGPDSGLEKTRPRAIHDPRTAHGLAKSAGELWCRHYNQRYGLDIRSIRYPEILSQQSEPDQKSTSYVLDLYHHAIKQVPFRCWIPPNVQISMVYAPDAVKAAIDLMSIPVDELSVRDSYNLQAMSFTPEEVTRSVQRFFPEFRVEYVLYGRIGYWDEIPKEVDDGIARKEWNWNPDYDIDLMTEDILKNLMGGEVCKSNVR